MTLKERIKEALNIPEENFHNHNSDLQILYSEEIMAWLKENDTYPQNITTHMSDVSGQSWYGKRFIEIPFAYEEYNTNWKKHVKEGYIK